MNKKTRASQLKRRRAQLVAQIPDSGEWIRGSLRKAYLNCGQSVCGCHKSKRFRHGPYWYLSWTDEKGKTKGKLIKQGKLGKIEDGLKAYGKLWKGICEISEINVALKLTQ